MSGPRWEQIKQLFHDALELAPDERHAFLANACADDSALQSEVESLIASHESAPGFIEQPAGEVISKKLMFAAAREGDSTAAASDFTPSTPDYELISVCGEGAFGNVWIVRDRVGAYRAMKVIELDRLTGLGVSEREIKALGTYCRHVPNHPNLVQIFHIGGNDEMLYYTMELADDLRSRRPVRKTLPPSFEPMTLRGLLESGRLNTDTAVEITLRLLKGLECLHEMGLVHRDIKPANVIFVNREVKLADVSLVSMSRSQMSMVGTPNYMPPDDQMDATADTYALGKMLYEMITGRDLSSFPSLPMDEQISSTRLDLDKLDALLRQACASRASERFASAGHMRSALLDCRFPLHDSPLLELANREYVMGMEDSGLAMAELQKAVREIHDTPGSGSARSRRATLPQSDAEVLWAVLDRLIKILPWIVILILGLVLIRRLT